MVLGEHNYSVYKVDKKLVREKVSVSDLRLGMYVVELDRPWLETPFLFQGFIIHTEEEIDQLANYCEYVFIDVAQTEIKYQDKTRQQRQVKRRDTYKISTEKALAQSVSHYDHAKRTVDNVLTALRFSQEINTEEVKTVVKDCVKDVLRNPNAMLWLTQIKHKDDYTAEHCLRVSVLCVALGRELDLLEQELIDLGIGGMLHDVGKVKVPDEILNKEGALTAEEYEIMKTHTSAGRSMLMSKSDVPPIAVDIAYSHHEQMNGRGYPRGIEANKIPYFAKIVAVVDAFDAITSDRVYCKGRSTLEALRILYDCRGSQFDEEVVRAFIRLIGIYPPGHLAELTNGEVGIILSCPPRNKLKPKLIIVRNAEKKLCSERILDLAKDQRDAEGRPIRVKEIFTDGAFGVHLQEYKDKGLRFDLLPE